MFDGIRFIESGTTLPAVRPRAPATGGSSRRTPMPVLVLRRRRP